MSKALIGNTGFVGSTLTEQTSFTHFFRSTNIEQIENQNFESIVCAGAPAQKWLANREPKKDFMKIEKLIKHLQTISCDQFVLISTVDVFKDPINVNEQTEINESELNAYGKHRRYLETFVKENFKKSLIIRLPGLVGKHLRKNVIFDLKNKNNLDQINSEDSFQFYPMDNLWRDIQISLKSNLTIVHLTAEPVSVKNVAKLGFGIDFDNKLDRPSINYDMRTAYGDIFNSSSQYQYTAQDSINAIKLYASLNSTPLSLNGEVKG